MSLEETSARVIKDSISHDGDRLTTMVVTFHRFVLSEFNTHRVFSRSSASSRAIPIEKTLEKLDRSRAYPVSWPSERSGMQGGEELSQSDLADGTLLYDSLFESTAVQIREYLSAHDEKGSRLHKSVLNRFLEPFLWHTVIITSTDWQNFFNQRAHHLAQPEIRVVAEMMKSAYEESRPTLVRDEDYHLPFIDEGEIEELGLENSVKASVARCARVSYLNHEGQKSLRSDLKLYDRLVSPGDGPSHAAPFEHVARPMRSNKQIVRLGTGVEKEERSTPRSKVSTISSFGKYLETEDQKRNEDLSKTKFFETPILGNLYGWLQLRHEVFDF